MLRNYFKIALRNLIKNKVYSFINIGGLAVGMAVAMLIWLWMIDELSFNKHHKNYETLYQVKIHQTFDGERITHSAMPYPMGEELRNKYPSFKAVAMCDWGSDKSLIVGNQKYNKKCHYIGEDAIDMFSLNILNGDKNPLKDPYSIVLTDETALTLFGEKNPIGKIIKVNNEVDLKVTAVVAKQPKNATLQFDFLMPWQLQAKLEPDLEKYKSGAWGDNSYQVFVQLKEGVSLEKTNELIKSTILVHFPDNEQMEKNIKPEFFLHPMAKWKLYGEFKKGKNTGGFIQYIKMFGTFGLIVLIIACINFMNLSTARSEKRAKEIGIRKAIGSKRKQLISQFLIETVLISFLSMIIAIFLVLIALPAFNKLTEKILSLQMANPLFWFVIIIFTVLTGLIAGSYPALYLSSFNPIKVLKGTVSIGKSASLPRKILVIMQFTFSIALMISTIIIYQQVRHGKNRPIGFNSKGLISVNSSKDLIKNYTPFGIELSNTGVVSSICKTSSPPSEIWSSNDGWEWKGSMPDDKSAAFSTIATNYDYVKTIGINLKLGRDFSTTYATDSLGVILNEAAVKRMGLKNPIGEIVKWNGKALTVIGVIQDMPLESPFHPISPLTVVFDSYRINVVNIRINPNVSLSEAIKKITPIFEKYNPGFPFDYKFADEQYAKKFKYEELIGNLTMAISLLAIFISCMGLFGLASYMAEQRTKEIGIRKVLGANILNITTLLSKEFIKLVLISIVISAPIAYYFMFQWLKNYSYRTEIGFGVFLLVTVVAILIALFTVSFQAIKAALANPIESLRTE